MRFILRLLGVLVVDSLNLEKGEKPLLLLGRANLPGDQIAGLEIEAPDLRRRYINVLRTWQVVETLRAQEPESLCQDLEHALGKQHSVAFGVLLQNVED